MKTKIANKDASRFVQQRAEFRGSNLYARKSGDRYIVFSYGEHWPLWIYTDGKWYENTGKFSATTSKHKSQSRPETYAIPLPCDKMKEFY